MEIKEEDNRRQPIISWQSDVTHTDVHKYLCMKVSLASLSWVVYIHNPSPLVEGSKEHLAGCYRSCGILQQHLIADHA